MLGFLLALSSCEKEGVDALPEATQEGKNKMGCLVDGKAWKPYEAPQLGAKDPFTVYWSLRDQGHVALTLSFSRDSQPKLIASGIYFYVPNIKGPSTITLDQPGTPSQTSANPAYGNFINHDATPDLYYLTGPTATGQLTITRFDTTARIVSGTFAFTGRTDEGSTVQVSEGRFDMQMERR
ncbi:hypothetical protein GCM10027348_32750 [Hymenobacter tenuis]